MLVLKSPNKITFSYLFKCISKLLETESKRDSIFTLKDRTRYVIQKLLLLKYNFNIKICCHTIINCCIGSLKFPLRFPVGSRHQELQRYFRRRPQEVVCWLGWMCFRGLLPKILGIQSQSCKTQSGVQPREMFHVVKTGTIREN